MTSPAFLPVVSGPLQNKSRRLQKSAQVEEPDEEPKTSTSTLEMERVTLKYAEPQSKSEAVKPFGRQDYQVLAALIRLIFTIALHC